MLTTTMDHDRFEMLQEGDPQSWSIWFLKLSGETMSARPHTTDPHLAKLWG